jgi:hypothetical protein
MTPSITESQVFKTLGAFIAGIVTCEVIRLPVNRTPMPKGSFIAMSPGTNIPLSTNVTTYDRENDERSVVRPSQFSVQIDCYGKDSSDLATAISILLRDQYACDKFAESGAGVQPLYAGDPQQIPLVDGEAQYEERWTFNAALQVNPALTVAQEFAAELEVAVVNVVQEYPPT